MKGAVTDWEKTLILALPNTHFIFEPGRHYSCSNIGYAALGAALGRVASEPYLEQNPVRPIAQIAKPGTARPREM